MAELAKTVLEGRGYQTQVATGGAQALQILAEGESFNLLFSDVIMPGSINGVVLAREVRKLYSDMKILLTTGYTENAIDRKDANGQEFEVLSKP